MKADGRSCGIRIESQSGGNEEKKEQSSSSGKLGAEARSVQQTAVDPPSRVTVRVKVPEIWALVVRGQTERRCVRYRTQGIER